MQGIPHIICFIKDIMVIGASDPVLSAIWQLYYKDWNPDAESEEYNCLWNTKDTIDSHVKQLTHMKVRGLSQLKIVVEV